MLLKSQVLINDSLTVKIFFPLQYRAILQGAFNDTTRINGR